MMSGARPEVSGQCATMQAPEMSLPACLAQVRRRIPCSIRPRLFPDSGFGHERDPALHFGLVEGGEFGHAEAGRLEADGAKLVLRVSLLNDLDDGLAQGRARLLRHARRPVDAAPAGELDSRNAG